MRRRDKAVKTRRHKTLTRRAEPKAARRNSVAAGKETNVARLTRELKEAREQQTGTFKVLQVISSSPGELEPVFHAILENATRICGAKFGVLWRRFDDGTARIFASLSVPSAFAEFLQRGPHRPGPFSPINRVAKTRQRVHIADFRVDQAYLTHDPLAVAGVELGGQRTLLVVPMLKEDKLVGMIAIYRQEVRPFTDEQIELVENFAAQAVIAIENARLLNELRESLEQQTATSEVLQVISSSPGELEPVFQAMLGNATRLCEAKFGILYRSEGDTLRTVAIHGAPQSFDEERRRNPIIRPSPDTTLGRALATKQPVQISDILEELSYFDARAAQLPKLAGARTVLAVPMLKDNELIGAIIIFRQEVRPFTDKQIELVKNFADQAVVAIENTRLLNELRQRTDDLSQSLEQQTATSEVLKVISSSPGELTPIFKSMLENAVRICEASFGNLLLYENDAFQHVALYNAPQAWAVEQQRDPIAPRRTAYFLYRVADTKQVTHIADVALENPDEPIAKVAGARTLLIVPMLKENGLIGVIAIYRQEVRPFTDKQIELVKNFAAQAVIAIENTRLLNELNDLNQQLERRVADQVNEIERMGKLRRFLPPQVADLIVASGAEKQLESHRREITALFCDLRGFTGFSESSDPEDVMALLREYHAGIGEIINKYGGTLERYAGDGVMVVFNDPIPVDNPALQAVLMAIDMRAAIGNLIEKWRKLGHDIGFGIGIAHGFATLGTIGFEGRFDYAAIGTVSNVASRLCDEAKPGQILISPRVLMAVEDAISVEPVGEFKLKGISRPLATYNVLSAVSAKI